MSDIEMEILRTGTFRDANQRSTVIDEKMMSDLVSSYDGTAHPAPLVFGHPKTNGPAYGWIKSMKRVGDRVTATVEKVAPQVRELIASGAYRKVSASYFPPASTNSPKQGHHYLRHVGLLGASAPAIPGLAEIELSGSASDAVTIDLAMDDGASVQPEMLSILKTMIASVSKFLSEDQIAEIVPENVRNVLAGKPSGAVEEASFSAAYDGLQDVVQERLDKIEAAEVNLAALAVEKSKGENRATIEKAMSEGRIAPFLLPRIVEFANELDDAVTIEFASADGSKMETRTLAAQFREIIRSHPPIVALSEFTRADASSNEKDDAPSRAKQINEYRDEKAKDGFNLSAAEAARDLGFTE